MKLEEMRRRLQPMNLAEVSRQTGIHTNILYRITAGKTPSLQTFEKLQAWLESQS